MLMIFLNVIILCLDGSITSAENDKIDILMTILTYIFVVELAFKVISYGPKSTSLIIIV